MELENRVLHPSPVSDKKKTNGKEASPLEADWMDTLISDGANQEIQFACYLRFK